MTYETLLDEALKLAPDDRRRLIAALDASASDGPEQANASTASPDASNADDRRGKSVWDGLQELGLLPSPDERCELPHDLSTNPRHMEGFGLSLNDPRHPDHPDHSQDDAA